VLGQKIAATTHKPQTTRRQLRGVSTRGSSQLIFIDTPGLHRGDQGLHAYMVEQALEAARQVDVLAFLVEAHLKKNEDGTKEAVIHTADERALEELVKVAPKGVPMVLVVNKVDRLPDRDALLPYLKSWADKAKFDALIPISAMKHEGIDELLDALAERLPEGPFLFPEDSITDASEREIAAELIREKAMLELQQELPYKLAVVIEEFDESRRDDPRKPLIHIAAVLHVERETQKRIVVGKGGERIKTIGQRARKDLERLLDAQVMLELFVRVERDWTQSEKGLRKVGYTR